MAVKDSVLKALKESKDEFLSGEELSNRLAVSRTAVWKAIKSLREEGYPIEAVTNKGYMMMSESWLITEESLKISLPAKYKNNCIYIFDTIDSTNIKAKQLALQNAAHGTIVMARQQTSGRGRLGRSFFSPREGIYMSIIIRPKFDMSKALLVTSAAAVAVAESVEKICGLPAMIKWVNDIYLDGKKLCGISAEAITDFESGQIESLVIGIGINTTLNGFPPELLDIVTAAEGDYSKSALAAEVISRLLDLIEGLGQPDSPSCTEADVSEGTGNSGENIRGFRPANDFMLSYRKHSLVIGKTVKVYKGGYRKDITDESTGIVARVLDIDENGGLKVIYTDGSRETLNTGEVSIR